MFSKVKNYNKMSIETLLPFHFAFVKAAQLAQIEQYFGSLKQALVASSSDWQQSQILTPKKVEKLLSFSEPLMAQQIEAALQWGQQAGQSILGLQDAEFPQLLKELSDPPILKLRWLAAAMLHD